MNLLTGQLKCVMAIMGACAVSFAPQTTNAAKSQDAIGLIETKGFVALNEATDALIEAELFLGAKGQTDGFIQITLSTGAVRRLELIFAKPLGESSPVDAVLPTPLLIIAEDMEADAAIRPLFDRVIITRVPETGGESYGGDDVFYWDVRTTSLTDGARTDRLQFESPATLVRLDYEFLDREIGLPVMVDLDAPRQTVFPFGPNQPRELDFAALLRISRVNRASGFILAPLSERGDVYEAHFGAVYADEQFGFRVEIIAALPGATSTDDLLGATAVPLSSTTNPDCLIWNLGNGSSGEITNTATFDAESFAKYRPQFYFRTTDVTGR